MPTARNPVRWTRLRAGMALVLLSAIVLAAAAACGSGAAVTAVQITGSGTLVTREYEVATVSRLDIDSAFSATVERSAETVVAVTADDNVIDRVAVERRGATLRVELQPGTTLGRVEKLAVSIGMPDLRAVSVRGAGNVSISGFAAGGQVDISAAGASTVLGQLTAEQVEIALSGASRAELTGQARRASVEASGASRVELGGFQPKFYSLHFGASFERPARSFGFSGRGRECGA